ncbi:hypothetical protein EYF80_011817 [Liparis tanakae]|uniref:Uncharacterized protein n=1 Tax=Liparis tanakae TaxID=230148 RepID=A0A4Z2ILL6_9TELE|nr:hypothetical protein EYF80_011817 [Liparis tanakae]
MDGGALQGETKRTLLVVVSEAGRGRGGGRRRKPGLIEVNALNEMEMEMWGSEAHSTASSVCFLHRQGGGGMGKGMRMGVVGGNAQGWRQ